MLPPNVTKDSEYLVLTYMTGILPIPKYSSGSSLSHFDESYLHSHKVRPALGEFFPSKPMQDHFCQGSGKDSKLPGQIHVFRMHD